MIDYDDEPESLGEAILDELTSSSSDHSYTLSDAFERERSPGRYWRRREEIFTLNVIFWAGALVVALLHFALASLGPMVLFVAVAVVAWGYILVSAMALLAWKRSTGRLSASAKTGVAFLGHFIAPCAAACFAAGMLKTGGNPLWFFLGMMLWLLFYFLVIPRPNLAEMDLEPINERGPFAAKRWYHDKTTPTASTHQPVSQVAPGIPAVRVSANPVDDGVVAGSRFAPPPPVVLIQNPNSANGAAVFQHLLNVMTTPQGLDRDALFCTLGSLAGYAVQAHLRSRVKSEAYHAQELMQKITTADGQTYISSKYMNLTLSGPNHSVWGYAVRAVQQSYAQCGQPCPALLDMPGLLAYVESTRGTAAFGKPRFPAGHQTKRALDMLLQTYWPMVLSLPLFYKVSIADRPLVFASAIQSAICHFPPEAYPPEEALAIVMECAVSMSQIDLELAPK